MPDRPATAPAPAPAPDRGPQVRTVIGAALGMAVGFATFFLQSVGVFAPVVAAEAGWGVQAGSLAFAAGMLGLTVACPVIGRLMDRWGVRRVVLTAAVAYSLLLLSLAVQGSNLVWWVLTSFLLGVTGAATTVLGYLAVLPQWFHQRLGLAIGIAMVGLGVGSVTTPLLAQALIDRFGWRGAYTALAVVALLASVVAFALIRERTGVEIRTRGGVAGAADVEPSTRGPVVDRRRLTTLFAAAFLVSAGTLFLSPQVAGLLADQQVDVALAARALALTGAGIFLGRLATGLALDHLQAPIVATAFFTAGAVGFGLLLTSTGAATSMAGFALVGLAVGAEGDLLSYLVRVYLGLAGFGRNYGTVFAGYGLGAVVGPVLASSYVAATGDYDLPLVVAPALLLTASGLLLSLGRYRLPARRADADVVPVVPVPPAPVTAPVQQEARA